MKFLSVGRPDANASTPFRNPMIDRPERFGKSTMQGVSGCDSPHEREDASACRESF
jgi:hypothetical protein